MITVISFATTFCVMNNSQAAILDQSLSSMFVNVTNPGTANNGMRGSFAGGSIYARTPNSSIVPFAIDPPRLSLGCGGIDATLGGFSFISADKLMIFFRKVIQQAAPVAFKLALQQFAPALSQILSDFQTWAQKISAMSANSCQLATGIASTAVDGLASLTNSTSNSGAQQMTGEGFFADAAKAADEFISKPGAYLTKIFSSDKETDTKGNTVVRDNNAGNLTWRALQEKQDMLGFQLGIDSDEQRSMEIIMSIIGTRIFATAEQLAGGQPTEEGTTGLDKWENAVLRLKDLVEVNPADQKIQVMSCDNKADCIKITVKEYAYSGFNGYVRKMFFGTTDITSEPTPDSIVGKMGSLLSASCSAANTSGCASPVGLTSAQYGFLNSIAHVPVMAYLKKTQHDKVWMARTIESLMEVIVAEAAYQYGDHVMKLTKGIYNGTNKMPPEKYDERLKELGADISFYRNVAQKGLEKQKAVLESIDIVYRNSPELKAWQRKNFKTGV